MEIKFSNSYVDETIFSKKVINGVYTNSNLNIYPNLETLKVKNSKIFGILFLKNIFFNFKEKIKIINLVYGNDFKKVLWRNLFDLSNTEMVKILTCELLMSKNKTIIFHNVDEYFIPREYLDFLKSIKTINKTLNKIILITSNNIDILLNATNHYTIIIDDKVVYYGNDFSKFGNASRIISFINTANSKSAKLSYYKEPSDLLKAIYRSVKK